MRWVLRIALATACCMRAAVAADLRAGVYPGLGAAGILEALTAAEGVAARTLEWCSPDALSGVDVVVIPHGRRVSMQDELRPWRAVLRRYVELGGGIVLTHNAVGYRGEYAGRELFPEIETAIPRVPDDEGGRKDAWTFRKAPDCDHALAARLPDVIRHAYCDHIAMYPGPLGWRRGRIQR